MYSLGLITIILGALLFLSKKEKLGKFGRMFINQIIKSHKGKQKWIVYSQTALFLSIGFLTVISIHIGNNEFSELKDLVINEFKNQGILIKSGMNVEAIKQISSQISPQEQIESIATLPLLSINDYKIFAVVLAVTDHLLGGWVMYFWQVVLIESIEILLFLGLTRKILLKKS